MDSEELSSFEVLLKKVFSYEALSKEGISLDNHKIALLSDVEILSWMKQNISDKGVSEYFSRDERKSPIWKSHEEFLFYLDSNEEKAIEISDFMLLLLTYLNNIEDLSLTNADKNGGNEFEYVLLPAKSSFFAKINAKNIYIRFGSDERQYTDYESIKTKEESQIVNNKKYEFFYLYSSRK